MSPIRASIYEFATHTQIVISGTICQQANLTSCTSSTSSISSISGTETHIYSDFDGDDVFDTDVIETGSLNMVFFVPRSDPISITASLEARAAGVNMLGFARIGGVTADSSQSLRFNPEAFFGLSPGATANSFSLGLVDNQLPAFLPVPVPGAFVLLISGLVAIGAWRRAPIN